MTDPQTEEPTSPVLPPVELQDLRVPPAIAGMIRRLIVKAADQQRELQQLRPLAIRPGAAYFRTHVTHIGPEPVIMIHVCVQNEPTPRLSQALTRQEALAFGKRLVRFGKAKDA